MHITFEPAFGVLLIVIAHTIITHLFNWLHRVVLKEFEIFVIFIGLFHFCEVMFVFAMLTGLYLK
jgi:hypothetical protein